MADRRQPRRGGDAVFFALVRRAVAVSCLLATVAPRALAAESVELAVKATYLYKLEPFVTWPDGAISSPSSPFTLCIVGNDPFGDLLDRAIAGQAIQGHPITVRRLDAIRPDSHCQLAYIEGGGTQSVAAALDAVRGAPVLTVTDSAQPGAAKGIINFIIQDNHVRFEIDDAEASRDHLEISSKLLNIAVSVTPKP